MRTYIRAIVAIVALLTNSELSAQQWTRLPSPLPEKLNFYSNPAKPTLISFGGNLYVTTDSGVAISSDDGSTWTNRSVGQPVLSLWHTTQSLLIEGWLGLIRSVDDGRTWSARNTTVVQGYLGEFNAQLYSYDRGISRSTDDGQTWNSWSIPGEYLVMAQDSSYLIASDRNSVNGNVLYRSSDSGLTWEQLSTLPAAWCLTLRQKGNLLFAGTLDRVYVSNDHGSHWIPSRNGMPPKTQVNDLKLYQNMIVAGTANGVFASSDDGDSWYAFNDGLGDEPNVVEVMIAGNYMYAFAQIPEAALYRRPLVFAGVQKEERPHASMYPNPTTGILTVQNTSRVVVCNAFGEECKTATSYDGEVTLDLSMLPAGIYFVRTAEGRIEKVIKQ